MEQSSEKVGRDPDGHISRAEARRRPPCLAHLRALLPGLTEAEHRTAEWILTHPDETLVLSINEVARQAGVGVGTVARLCSRLGYAKFSELRVALAVEMISPTFVVPEQVGAGDDPRTIIDKVAQFGVQILVDTAALLDPAELARAARAITEANRLAFYAHGGYTSPIAALAQARFLVLEVLAAAYTGEWDQSASARLLRAGDVAVGLSYTGESTEVIDALRTASDHGATTICITNTPQSPITKAAQICLLASSPEGWSWGHPASSRMGMLAVIDALYATALLMKFDSPDSAWHSSNSKGASMSHQRITRRNLVRTGAGAAAAAAGARYGLPIPTPALASQSVEPIEITYWHVNTETFGGPTNEVLFQQFTELNPSLTISDRYHENSYVGLMEHLQTALAAGDPPDVAQIGYLYMDYATGNFPFTPIEDLTTAYGPADFLASFPTNVLDLGRVGGRLAGLPYSISNPVTYFNSDLFQEADLDPASPPLTWEEWATAARAIKEATGKAGIVLEYYTGGNWLSQAMIESNGGQLLTCTDGALQTAFDSPEAAAAIQTWADLITNGFSLFLPGDQAAPAFLGGETAAFIGSIASRETLQSQASFELRAAPFPRFGAKEARLPVGGNALVVFAPDPARQEAAWKFIQFLEAPAALAAWTEGTGYIPPQEGVADNPEYLANFLEENPIQAVGVAQTPNVVPWVSFPGPNGLQAGKVLSDAVEQALTGELGAQEALTAAAPQINDLLTGQTCE